MRVLDGFHATFARAGPRHLTAGGAVLVVAPHADDETLGCGGTVAQLCEAGHTVKVLILSDGTSSHAVQNPEALARMRRDEARAACAVLGIAEADVHFCNLPDGRLAECVTDAAEEVVTVVRRDAVGIVFAPHTHDVHDDHEATNRIVVRALRDAGRAVTLFEYPVWLYDHWPWVPKAPEHSWRSCLAAMVRLMGCTIRSDVSATLPKKQRALNCYSSQMTRPEHDADAAVLADVGGGDFLKRFERAEERFRMRSFKGARAADG